MGRALERALRAQLPESADDAAAASAAVAKRAEAEGLVESPTRSRTRPSGGHVPGRTQRGLVRVGLPSESFDDILSGLADELSPRMLELPARVDDARRELDEYFAGRRHRFDLALDKALITQPFRSSVLEATSEVPFGEAITYGEVAARAGSPRAYRAAGYALGAEPDPGRDPLPPGRALRRRRWRVRRRPGDEGVPPEARGVAG